MEEAVEPPAGKREVGGRWRPGLCLLAVAGALASAGGARADGSLLEALEAARTVAVGHLRAPEILDSHGRTGRFQVERALVGPAREDDALQVAWEERAPGRPPRFAAGERLLLGLGPLPADSIWRQRFPGRDAMAITGKGLAFLRQPSPASLAALEAFLRLPPPERDRARGVAALAALVEAPETRLARSAVSRLEHVPGLEQRLDAASQASLARVLRNPQASPELRRGLLALVETRRLHGLSAAANELAAQRSELQAEAVAARIALAGSPSSAELATWAANPDPRMRRLAIRHARGAEATARVRSWITGDPSPQVRAAAAQRWLEWHGVDGLDAVVPALFDAAQETRGQVSRSIGQLGADAVPTLVALLTDRSGDPAHGPIAALYFAGAAGRRALMEIAREHPDEGVRAMARLALGEPLDRH